MACKDWEDIEGFEAFLLEHTGLPWHVIETVLDANDRFWEMKMRDDAEPDGG